MPGLSTYNDTVSVPNPGAVNNLTVAVDLTDQASVSNLNLTLFAPNGDEITLVQNQIDATGTGPHQPGPSERQRHRAIRFHHGCHGNPRDPRRDDLRRQCHPEHLRSQHH